MIDFGYLGSGLGAGGLITVGILIAKLNKLWQLHDDIVTAIDRINLIWGNVIGPAITAGLVREGQSYHLTDKGNEILTPEIREQIDILMGQKDIKGRKDPSAAVATRLRDPLIALAKELGYEPGAIVGVAITYAENHHGGAKNEG